MKNIFKIFAALTLTAVLTTACEERVLQTDPVESVAAINSNTLTIIPTEGGSVQAFIGDEVSAQGINLEHVSKVEFYHSSSATTVEAEITYLDHTNITFVIPFFDLAQADQAYPVSLYIYDENIGDVDGDGEIDPIFSYSYYITIPIVDVLIDETTPLSPMEGTVGDELVITGRNLGQVSAITFAGTTIAEADFVSHLAETITFAIPEGTYDAGTSTAAVSVTWNGGDIVSVTEEFAMKTPLFDAYAAPATTPLLNEYIYLTGENLDLVSDYTWDGFSLSVYLPDGEEASSDKVTLYIPAVMDDNHTGVMAKDILASYGSPAQAITAASAVEIDATKLAIASPEITSIRAVDDGDDTDALKFYLGKTVTMTGENMNGITAVSVGGESATIVGTPTGTECQFIIPDTFDFDTFTAAEDMEIVVVYGDDSGSYELTDKPTIKVYPMYYYKDVTMYPGCSSSSYYTTDAYNSAFFMPNIGTTLTPDEWVLNDPYAVDASGSNPAVTTSKTLNTSYISMDDYYAVEPSFIVFFDSGGSKLSIGSGTNSTSMLKCHRYWDYEDNEPGSALPSTYGTNLTWFVTVTDTESSAYQDVTDGSLEAFTYSKSGSSCTPAYNNGGNSTSTWETGSVIMVINETYTAAGVSDKPNSLTESHNVGYIHIKEVTCIQDTTVSGGGARNEDLSGYVKFDYYWSPVRNAGY